uniref:Protein kinase domain-containing protein n=1 Tax=Fagus sylvatica TaxID=28930 RepID=A0A2N9HIY3_FAGSY
MRSWLRNHFFKRTEERKERERAFLENGSLLLEKLIVSCNAKPIPIRTFSAQELRQATDNYANAQFCGWYKGSLEGRMMSGHSNVLKPIGCCLETPSPISVYEFAANGFLADRVYVSRVANRKHQPMAWGSRLKIARQIAHVISYLHTAFSRPVLHMSINMRSILLDESDVPKLIHFFYSVSIPEGETDVEPLEDFRDMWFSTPELRASGKVTEKNDVYNFGQLLLELLTGEDSLRITRLIIEEDSSFVAYMHNSAQGRSINEILDPAILAEEGGVSLDQQLQAVLELALTCTKEDPHRRPTMVDVTKELRRIERFPQVAEDLWGSLRNLKLNERFKMLLWRIANDILPTGARMKQPCEMETTCCPLCKTEEETCLHLFKSCLAAKAAWFSSNWGFCIESLNANSSYDLIKSIVIPPAHVLNEQVTKEQFVLMAAKIMDYIWRLRNQVMFENKKLNFQAIPFEISQQFEEQGFCIIEGEGLY